MFIVRVVKNTNTLQNATFLNVTTCGILRLKRDGTRAETRFRLSPKRTSPFKSAGGGGAEVQSKSGSPGVRISVSNAGYTTRSEVV
jgi:hypothetical protein